MHTIHKKHDAHYYVKDAHDTFRETVPTDLGSTNRPLCYPLVVHSVGMNRCFIIHAAARPKFRLYVMRRAQFPPGLLEGVDDHPTAGPGGNPAVRVHCNLAPTIKPCLCVAGRDLVV